MKKIIAAVLIMIFCAVGICVVGPLCDPASTHSVCSLDCIGMTTMFISGIAALVIFIIDFVEGRK